MKTINLEFQYTEAEAVRAVIELTKSTTKSIAIMPWVGGFLIAMTLVFAFTESKNVFGFGALLFFGILFISIPLLMFWTAKRDFRNNPNANKTIQWEINEEWLRNETEGTEAQFIWKKLIRVVERKSGFLLFPQQRLAHWIPKSAFKSDKEMDEFRQLARKHGIKVNG